MKKRRLFLFLLLLAPSAVTALWALTPASALDLDTYSVTCSQPGSSEFWERAWICPSGDGQWKRPAYQFGSSISQTCNAGLAGMVQWTGTEVSPNNTLEYCNGSAWTAFGGGSTNIPDPFSFTDVSDANLSTTISSNAVTLSGFTGALAAACGTGCTEIARNSTWLGTTTAIFLPSDTIAIRQTSSSSPSTQTTASVTVGTRTSGTWTVTTGDNAPDAFSFTNQTDVALSTTISSNAVTLSGFAGPQTATCGTGCTAIARNGSWGGTTVTGFYSGDTIAIRQTSSSSYNTQTTATVTVGGTTSGVWGVTTIDACPSVGDVCPNGTINAGLSPDGNVRMYTTRCDVGQTWSGSTCTGTRGTYAWGPTSSTGYTSQTTGKTNSAGLAALGSSYAAAYYCENLTAFDSSDWYLPAYMELYVLYTNRTAIGNFDTSGANYYWSSSESSSTSARYRNFYCNCGGSVEKYNTYYVRCVRR